MGFADAAGGGTARARGHAAIAASSAPSVATSSRRRIRSFGAARPDQPFNRRNVYPLMYAVRSFAS